MHIVVPLLAHTQPLHPVKPRQGALHHPAMAPQSLTRLDAPASDAGNDMSLPRSPTEVGVVVPLVAVSLRWAPAWSAAWAFDGRNGVDERKRLALVVHIGGRQQRGQRQSSAVYDQVMLAARLPSVRRVWTRSRPPFSARTLLESNATRLQSMHPFWPSSFSGSRCNVSNTPARLQRRGLRQHVAPLHPNTSVGRSLQAMPVLSTKMMPRGHALSSRTGRPLPPWCRCRGRSGATLRHSPSGTSSRFMLATMPTAQVDGIPLTSKVHL